MDNVDSLVVALATGIAGEPEPVAEGEPPRDDNAEELVDQMVNDWNEYQRAVAVVVDIRACLERNNGELRDGERRRFERRIRSILWDTAYRIREYGYMTRKEERIAVPMAATWYVWSECREVLAQTASGHDYP